MKRVHVLKRQWYMPLFLIALPVVLSAVFCYLDEQVLTADLQEDVSDFMGSYLEELRV